MVCFNPIDGFRRPDGAVTFSRAVGYSDKPVTVPCGRCTGCRLERSKQWATRLVHEKSMHVDSCFVTLTYDDAHLPEDESVSVREMQLFMKRLRKGLKNVKVRFYCIGEYGDEFGRPHYHLLLFGTRFSDGELFKTSARGDHLYISSGLSSVWEDRGFATVGDVTWESAAYCARYVMKKINGDAADAHYEHVTRYGEIVQRAPEFSTMSRRPGIGATWFAKYHGDVYPKDFVTIGGKKFKPPRAYDRQYEFLVSDEEYEALRCLRIRRARGSKVNTTSERLKVRETIQLSRMQMLRRM